jgi:hypothetical protein
MKTNLLTKTLIAVTLLILAVPVGASAQGYRDRNRDGYNNRDQYNQRDVRVAINSLERSSARLENDLNVTQGRRVLGIFQLRTTDNNAIMQVRDFRRAVSDLRTSSNDGRSMNRSADEAQRVLNRGVQLDRYLRLRTGSTNVDADLSELRSNLHILADAYGLTVPY